MQNLSALSGEQLTQLNNKIQAMRQYYESRRALASEKKRAILPSTINPRFLELEAAVDDEQSIRRSQSESLSAGNTEQSE